jgi:guanosine-3',5'-bis(diphosphate) 3'-pyrophosphohydrolase
MAVVVQTAELTEEQRPTVVAPEGLLDIEQLLAVMRGYLGAGVDLTPVRKAYEYAARAHEGQFRESGEPYIQHPLATAMILANLQLDRPAIMAALLHDVPEDTNVSLEKIRENFGNEIAELVDGVTKLRRIRWETLEEEQAENLRKMFLAMARDIRVVLIRLADRLHNIRTLDALPRERQLKIAQETLEIYAPLANRLGIWELKWQLEDGAFRYLEPEKYRELARLLASKRSERERIVAQAAEILARELEANGIHATITGRAKHIYSIYQKMLRKGVSFDEVYDLLALRVLVNEVQECYHVLGVVHTLWHPIPGQFDDYIANPKGNMYQSLHTAVLGPDGKPLEVQIRTHEMHRVAEYGIAAHWRYKEGGGRRDQEFETKLAWLRQLMAWQRELSDAREFVESVKMDIFQDQVFVFTPRGEVKDLPAKSTPIDFAYRIHTDVGHRCIGAKVNGRLVPLDYQLQNGDIVEIITAKGEHGPSRDWLNIVQTAHAKEKIRQWFKQRQKEENIARGKELLERELKRLGLGGLGSIEDRQLEEVAQALKMNSVENLFASIGFGAVSPHQVILRLGLRTEPEPEVAVSPGTTVTVQPSVASGMSVMGVGDLLTRLATCCKPVPGDRIIGYITRGRGVTIHRADCPNILAEDEKERLVSVEWGTSDKHTYPVTIRVEAWDRPGLLRDVTTIVADEKLNILASTTQTRPDEHTATITVTVEIGSLAELSRLMSKIERVKDVFNVVRETAR